MTEKKIRKPKGRKVQVGSEVKIEELEYGHELRLNLKVIFDSQGDYSNAMVNMKATATIEEGTDPDEAATALKEFVHEHLDEAMEERIETFKDVLENQSFR